MEKRKIVDLFVIGLFVALGAFFTLYFKTNLTVSVFFYFILPIIYLVIRGKFNYKKIFFTTILWTLIFGILDVITNANKGWFVPDEQLLLKYKIFGWAPLLEVVWFGLLIFFILLFYEHFIEERRVTKISKRAKWAVLMLILTTVFILILFWTSMIDKIRYVYLFIWGIYFIPPIIYLLFKKAHFIKKLVLATIPFFIINLIFELTSLYAGHWSFPGEYIGTVILFGLSFAFEEFLFFIVLAAAAILSYYELFIDDMK